VTCLLRHWGHSRLIALCRDKARKEQEQLAAELGEEAEQMSSKFISQLNYMDACMKESVRKYSTLLLVRLAMQDVCFTTTDGQEFLLPQGTLSRDTRRNAWWNELSSSVAGRTVAFSPFLTHYNEEIYPDPSRYDPERFTDLERKLFLTSNRHFVQFGAGVHKCPVPPLPWLHSLITI
jgi:cytochrome P450